MENSIGGTIISRPFQKRENFPPIWQTFPDHRASYYEHRAVKLCTKRHNKVAYIDRSSVNSRYFSIIYRSR